MFCEKKNLSVRRKNLQSVERGKWECKISGVQKKKEIERKVSGKNQSFFGEIFFKKVKDFAKFVFASWALCLCQGKVAEKMIKIFKVFFGLVFEVKVERK